MSAWIVYSKDGLPKCEARKLEYSGEFMGACSVSINVSAPTPIGFEIGDWLEYRGERFELNYDPSVVKESSSGSYGEGFVYDNVVFNSLSDELTRCDFLDVVPADNGMHYSSLPTFSFFAESVSVLAERIQENLNRVYTGDKAWKVMVHPEFVSTKNVNVSASNLTCWDALALVKNQFDANFIIKGRTITIGTSGIAVGNLFTYGKGNGLYSIEKNAESNQKIITRLRAYGSTRNLPSGYYRNIEGGNVPNNMAVQNLMLPSFPVETLDPYLDSKNISELGVREGTVFFDGSGDLEEIYPTMEGMTAEELKDAGINIDAEGALDVVVSAEQIADDGIIPEEGEIQKSFTITLKDIGFDINEYLSASGTATISMKDGMCGGREFEIAECKKDGSNYVLTCNRSEDSGLGLMFPYKDYQIKEGDKFVLLNLEMPDVYIKAASQRLLAAATEYLSKNDYVRYSYTPSVDNIYLARQHDEAVANGLKSIHDTIKEGDFILFEDDDFGISGSITIDSLSIKEYADESVIPEYELTLREEKSVGTIEKIQNQISSILNGGAGGGNINTEQVKSIVAAVGSKMFLSKQKDDITPFNLGIGKNLSVGGDATIEGTTNSREVIAKDSVHSEEFVSGFTGGKGWAIRFKEFLNAAGITEEKAVAEFDDVIVRGALRVYEFIVSQMIGENDNRIFTGMMEVDHYDASDGKIYLKTNGGKLYNPFRVDDVIIVQQYGGNPSEENGYYVTKQYEFIVTEVGIGEMGEDRLDWVRFRNFTTSMEGGNESLITERDTLVRIDNLSDANRKGVIQLMSVGEDTPYMDFIYGAKTDPENSLKGRLGNLGGVYNPLFGWLKEFGAYLTNLYAVGEFRIAHTGEDIADAIEILKGTFRTNFSQTSYDITEEADFFTNATFTNDCEYWELSEEETSYFAVGDVPQFFNYELYASESSFAGLSEYDGRSALRLTNGYAKQLNDNIRKPSTHIEYSDVNNSLEKVGEEVVDTLYLSIRVYAATDSIIELGFTDSNGSFIENDFHHNESLEASKDGYTINLSGKWDGEGDFTIRGAGDIYIDHLSLTDKPLENFRITTSTAIEQDAKSIKLLGEKVDNVSGAITTVQQTVDAQKGEISSVAKRVSDTETSISSLTISVNGISSEVSKKVDGDKIASTINQTAQSVKISASKIELTGQVTFSMFDSSTQNTINSKVTQSNIDSSIAAFGNTIIEGGYIKTTLINADAIVAKQLQATDEYGNILTVNSTGLFITGKERTERVRLRGDAASAYLRIKSTAGHTSDLSASGLYFTYGDYSTIITYNGITLGDGCDIKGFKLGNTSPTSVKTDTDFIRTGSSIALPAPSLCWGKVIFTRTTAECTISSTGKNIYPRSGALTESFTRTNTAQFFISDGTYWYEFYCG